MFPLAADVGTGTGDHVEADLLRDFDETHKIQNPAEIELSGVRFVQIPAEIGFHGIESELTRFGQPVPPLSGMDPEVVDRSGAQPETLLSDFNFASNQADLLFFHLATSNF